MLAPMSTLSLKEPISVCSPYWTGSSCSRCRIWSAYSTGAWNRNGNLRNDIEAIRVNPWRCMDEAELKRFIQHYERLTRWMLEEMAGCADVAMALNPNHQFDPISN